MGARDRVIRSGDSPDPAELLAAGKAVRGWFREHGLPFFFRMERDPYTAWVLEIMGQQTQLSRAIAYLERWLPVFPDIRALAAAEESAILRAWEGLGYYSRARNLHKAARFIMKELGGRFPDSYEDILRLPGVGEYTAAAISSIVYHQPVPAVDANVLRVFARLLLYEGDVAARSFRERVRGFVGAMFGDSGRPGELNEGLMELGERVCGRRQPLCGSCPLEPFCRARAAGVASSLPQARKKPEVIRQSWMVALIRDRRGRALLLPPGEGGIWPGLWTLPRLLLEEEGEIEPDLVSGLFSEAVRFSVTVQEILPPVRHSYTRFRLLFYPVRAVVEGPGEGVEGEWLDTELLATRPLPSGMRKVLREFE